MNRNYLVWVLVVIALWTTGSIAQPDAIQLDFPREEFLNRRGKAMAVSNDGIILIRAKTNIRSYEQHGFLQNPLFYYFTGLSNRIGVILALDSRKGESWLFVPDSLNTFPAVAEKAMLQISAENAALLGVEYMVDWNGLIPFLDQRIAADTSLKIYTEYQSIAGNGPAALDIIEDPWLNALQKRYPDTDILPPNAVNRLRLIKSEAEIEALRGAGENAARALIRAMEVVRPGMHSREVEAAIVYECSCHDGNGVYFWPVVHAGENTVFPAIFGIFADYENMGSRISTEDLLRIDIGCDFNHYKSDVGRTVPASGKFTAGQGEAYDLLVAAYKAGLAVIRDGVSVQQVFESAIAGIKDASPRLKTELGRRAYQHLISPEGTAQFILHKQGLGGAEGSFSVLKAGMVIAWEPMFAIDGQGYYLEDMLVVRKDGYEMLTPGAPYTSGEIEAVMAESR